MSSENKFGKLLFQMIAGHSPRTERELRVAKSLNETARKTLKGEEEEDE